MRPCFQFKAKANDDSTTMLAIDEEIGFWGVQASDFRAALSAVKSPKIVVSINSPGGDVFAGLAIYNMLRASGKEITTEITGVAASAASLILMAGDSRNAPKNTFVMVHNPWGVAIGNASEMRETADILDKIGTSIQATYVERTGQPENIIADMLAVDTWMTADEAMASGFVTSVTADIEAHASFDMTKADLPAHIKAIYAAAKPTKTPAEIEAEAQAAETARLALEAAAKTSNEPVAQAVHAEATAMGLGEHADFFAVSYDTAEAATTRMKDAREIVSLCAFAKKPEAAKGYIREGKTVAEARTAMIQAMADADVHTSTIRPVAKSSDQVAIAKPSTNPYAARAAEREARKANKSTR